jgi:hypothetical protein
VRLEGFKSHKARLAILVLDDDERAPIFIEGEGPHGCHGAAARNYSLTTGGDHYGTRKPLLLM